MMSWTKNKLGSGSSERTAKSATACASRSCKTGLARSIDTSRWAKLWESTHRLVRRRSCSKALSSLRRFVTLEKLTLNLTVASKIAGRMDSSLQIFLSDILVQRFLSAINCANVAGSPNRRGEVRPTRPRKNDLVTGFRQVNCAVPRTDRRVA